MKALSIDSPIGTLTIVATDVAVVTVAMETRTPPAAEGVSTPLLRRAAHQLQEYFAGRRTHFDLPLGPEGTPFQRAVWRALGEIPYGETCSYADIARKVGRPTAVRAVGAANGANPIAVIVPCHRVIGRDGTLTGYGGGLPRKRWLLNHEATVAAQHNPAQLA